MERMNINLELAFKILSGTRTDNERLSWFPRPKSFETHDLALCLTRTHTHAVYIELGFKSLTHNILLLPSTVVRCYSAIKSKVNNDESQRVVQVNGEERDSMSLNMFEWEQENSVTSEHV